MVTQRFDGDLPYGVMTSAWPWLSTEAVLEQAAKTGAQEVELSALNSGGKRMADAADHAGAHLDIPGFIEDPRKTAGGLAKLANDHKLGICFGNYDRIHSENPIEDEASLNYMLRVIDFAAALGGRNGGACGVDVGMFWGWNRTKGVQQNLDAVAEKLYVLARYAEERGVRITSENCHMPGGWSPTNDSDLPHQVMRSAGSTLAGRLYVMDKLKKWGIKPGTIGFTWDPSHPETEKADPLPEAYLSFSQEPNVAQHIKGHNHNVAGEATKMAYFGGPAMPGWFADSGTPFYDKMKELGVPVGDCAWAQQYGRVTLPGVGDFCTTPFAEIYDIARGHRFSGRAIAENETPEKNAAAADHDANAITGMYQSCLEFMRPILWNGNKYNGRPFTPLDVAAKGKFEKMMDWREAKAHYQVPA